MDTENQLHELDGPDSHVPHGISLFEMIPLTANKVYDDIFESKSRLFCR